MTCSSTTIYTPDRRRWLVGAGLALALALPAPVVASGPSSAAAGLISQAQADLAREDGVLAEMRLRRALAQGAKRPDLAASMGEALLLQGDLQGARQWLGPAQFAPSTAVYGLRMLARLERRQGNLAQAGHVLDRALAIDRRDALVWVDVAELRYAGGEQLQAIDAAQQALVLDPGNLRALQFRGQLVRDRYGLKAALPWFEAGLARAPDDLGLLGAYAATLGELNRASEMLSVTRHILKLAPGNGHALFLQAVLAARAGDDGLARSMLDHAGRGIDAIPAAMLLEGAVELRAGNPNQAGEVLDRLLAMQPDNAEAQALMARALAMQGNDRDLVARFGELARVPGASAYLKTLVARAYENLGQRDLAAPLLDQAARPVSSQFVVRAPDQSVQDLASTWQAAPGDAARLAPYIRGLLASGRSGEAEALAERFRADHPGSSGAQTLAGDVQYVLGRPAPALERYRIAAAVGMTEPLLDRWAAALRKAGQAPAADQADAAYLVQNPSSLETVRLAAADAASRRDWSRAADLLAFVRQGEGSRDVELLSALSLAQHRSGDDDDALDSARAAYRLQRASPLATEAYAAALDEAGQQSGLATALHAKARQEAAGQS